MLTLDDLEFAIASARIDAYVDDDVICWGLTIRTQPMAVEDAGPWQPMLEAEVFLRTPAFALTSWTELRGTFTEVDATLAVYDQYALRENELVIDGGRIEWRGVSDVHWREDRYWEDLRIEAHAQATFDGFLCGRADEATARAELAKVIDPTGYAFVSNAGVSMLVPRY